MALEKGAKAVILMSHMGRPDGKPNPKDSAHYIGLRGIDIYMMNMRYLIHVVHGLCWYMEGFDFLVEPWCAF